jgi:imidazolonepropionase-like amidohydrolase
LYSYTTSIQKKHDLIIQNVTLFDGENVLENATIYVDKGVILKIESVSNKYPFYSKEVIDGKGKTIIPGLIDSHVHTTEAKDLRTSAKAGILTMLDLFAAKEDSLNYLRELSQSYEYAYYFSSGICATAPGGHGTQYGVDIPTISDINEVNPFIAARVNAGADYIKIILESLRPTFGEQELEALINTTHKNKKLAIVHIGSTSEAMMAIEKGADILAHLWHDATIDLPELQKHNSKNFYIIPTLSVYNKWITYFNKKPNPSYAKKYKMMTDFDNYLNEVRKIHRLGIPILAGTDAPNLGLNYGGDLYKELEYFVLAGLTPKEAIQTATLNPSRAFKFKHGLIKESYSADFLLVNGDVLTDIKRLNDLSGIWKKGIRIK